MELSVFGLSVCKNPSTIYHNLVQNSQVMEQTHQVLARKYRPKNFEEFVRQEHITKPLINALTHNRIHHAFLFTGTRGVGKTTLARILAKCLNCQPKITPNPCGTCDSCMEIAGGQSIDIIEFDAASHTKVDDMREILENAQYLPSKSRYKIYIIDEVHMLSKSSFNALLKTLEEPPSHIKFLFATTDPEKLPTTILSRCLHFSLQKINLRDIQQQLEKILTLESIEFDKPALLEIAKHGQGSMRDALSLLDQAIAYGGGKVEMSSIKEMLSLVDIDYIFSLAGHLITGNAKQTLAISKQLSTNGDNLKNTLHNLLEVLHQLSIMLLLPEQSPEQAHTTELKKLTKNASQAQLQLYYQIIVDGIKNFDLAPNSAIAFEMILLRMLAFNPNAPKGSKAEKKKPADPS